jgi:two-component system sensor histidine kinase PhcS
VSRNSEIKNSRLAELYRQYEMQLHKNRLGLLIFISVIFIALFSMLDVVMYEEVSSKLITVRLITDIILVMMIFILYRNWLINAKIMSFVWSVVIIVSISLLIVITGEGSSTPYYAGLNLIIVAAAALLPWMWYEMLSICLIMLALYTASTFFAVDWSAKRLIDSGADISILVNNLFFLSSTSTFCTLATFLNSKLRIKEFSLNYQLEEKNIKLQSTQAQLVHSEKINAIGNLSAGLLHEINNPLNYTLTAVQLVKMDSHVSSDEDLKDTVKDIEEGMLRIKNIVTDLRAFAYPEEADKQCQFAVHGAVESALRFTASETIDIEKIMNIPADLMVSASKTHIVQVLINLISNASRAILKSGKKGVLTISARAENNRIIIAVADNGIGMNEETVKKVFDPFFTTNEVGKGMGLGLSVSHTIVKNHGGNLEVKSKLGEGTEFYFDLHS